MNKVFYHRYKLQGIQSQHLGQRRSVLSQAFAYPSFQSNYSYSYSAYLVQQPVYLPRQSLLDRLKTLFVTS